MKQRQVLGSADRMRRLRDRRRSGVLAVVPVELSREDILKLHDRGYLPRVCRVTRSTLGQALLDFLRHSRLR